MECLLLLNKKIYIYCMYLSNIHIIKTQKMYNMYFVQCADIFFRHLFKIRNIKNRKTIYILFIVRRYLLHTII